jgi:SAM-dependent methyltransferase
MYNDIVDIYDEIFPLNQAFLAFLRGYLPEESGRVLDLGCGPGDVVGLLAKEGYQAVGIDNSEGMIAAAKANQPGIFYPYGFEELQRLDGPFNPAWCVGNSLSYLPNDRLRPFMVDVAALLPDQGVFILQVVNWDRFTGQGRIDFEVKPISEGRSFHRRYEPGERGTVIFHTALKRGEEVLGEWADVLYPKTQAILEAAANSAGLPVSGAYGDYGKTPFDPENSPALILVIKKT